MSSLTLFGIYAVVTLVFYKETTEALNEMLEKRELLNGGMTTPNARLIYELSAVILACAWIVIIPLLAIQKIVSSNR